MIGREIRRSIATSDIHHTLNAHVTKDAVMIILRAPTKPAEEQEHIAHANTVFGEMRLRRAMLSKSDMATIAEKRIVMTPCRAIAHMIGKADVTIACAAGVIGTARGDRQADRAAIDNRRRPATAAAVKALAAEDQPVNRQCPMPFAPRAAPGIWACRC